jgi:hypothetical protein
MLTDITQTSSCLTRTRVTRIGLPATGLFSACMTATAPGSSKRALARGRRRGSVAGCFLGVDDFHARRFIQDLIVVGADLDKIVGHVSRPSCGIMCRDIGFQRLQEAITAASAALLGV